MYIIWIRACTSCTRMLQILWDGSKGEREMVLARNLGPTLSISFPPTLNTAPCICGENSEDGSDPRMGLNGTVAGTLPKAGRVCTARPNLQIKVEAITNMIQSKGRENRRSCGEKFDPHVLDVAGMTRPRVTRDIGRRGEHLNCSILGDVSSHLRHQRPSNLRTCILLLVSGFGFDISCVLIMFHSYPRC